MGSLHFEAGKNDNAEYNCWEGVSRQSVRRYSKNTARRHRETAGCLRCTVTFSDMWKKRSCLLSLGGDLDYLVTHTQTHTSLFSLKSQISTHFHPSSSHCAPPLGHIMSRACDKEPGNSGGGGWGGQTVRLAWQASAGVFLCLPCLSLSVYL